MQKLNKIENIDHYISDTSPNADFKLYSKHFELIDLFLISTLEKDTILNDPTHKRMNENVDKLIKDETIRETLKTHLEDIKTTLSNINNVRGFMGDEERNLYNIKLSGTVDSISNKIELTILNLFNYNVLNEDVIQDNIVAAGGLDEINNRKREYIDLNCINLLPIDQWDKINITDDSFKYHNGNLNSDSSDTYNKLTADDLKKFLIFNKTWTSAFIKTKMIDMDKSVKSKDGWLAYMKTFGNARGDFSQTKDLHLCHNQDLLATTTVVDKSEHPIFKLILHMSDTNKKDYTFESILI